jgi:hypothetical protein
MFTRMSPAWRQRVAGFLIGAPLGIASALLNAWVSR